MKTPVHSSYIRRRDMDSVLNCLVTDDVGPGNAYARFMAQIRETLGCEYAAGLRSPVEALKTALSLLGLPEGARVACSALSPSYYGYAIRGAGFEPVWLDVLPASGAADPAELGRLRQKQAVAAASRAQGTGAETVTGTATGAGAPAVSAIDGGDAVAIETASISKAAITLEAAEAPETAETPGLLEARSERAPIGAGGAAGGGDGGSWAPVRALVLAGPFGIMPAFEAFLESGLPIIEDITQTLGAYSSLRKAGDTGAITLLSLESGGHITAGEGALLIAKGKREAAALRSVIEAMPRESLMSDMNASLGLAQLKELPRFQEKRKELYGLFQRALLQSRHGLLAQEGEGEPSYFAFPAVLRSGARDVRAYARKKDIETEEASAGTMLPLLSEDEWPLPQARALCLRCILFPLHPRIGGAGAQRIVKVLSTLP